MATRKDILFLWMEMLNAYGDKWARHREQIDPNNTWLNALNGFDTDMIKKGLHACLTVHPEWPPTLPQFRFLCLNIPQRHEAIQMIYKNTGKDIPFIRAMRHYIGDWNITNLPFRELGAIAHDAYDVIARRYCETASKNNAIGEKRKNHGTSLLHKL